MKGRPIIMTDESVRAILDGRKTQTRRAAKPQPDSVYGPVPSDAEAFRPYPDHPDLWCVQSGGVGVRQYESSTPFASAHAIEYFRQRCPYGKPGDRLWVRETWSDPFHLDVECKNFTGFYRASDPDRKVKWWSPMFMPRWASRLTLEITDVRVQRLHEISEEDAVSEGMERVIGDGGASGPGFKFDGSGYWDGFSRHNGSKTYHATWGRHAGICCCYVGAAEKLTPARCAYRHLWDKINGKKHPWASNPWVWAVTFIALAVGAGPSRARGTGPQRTGGPSGS